MPGGAAEEVSAELIEGIIRGMYRRRPGRSSEQPRVRLLASGALLPEAEAAASLLEEMFSVSAEVWSVTSFSELARDIQDTNRANLLARDKPPRQSFVAQQLSEQTEWNGAPVIAVSDYIKSLPEQLRSAIDGPYFVLGTDGFGRSDTRQNLRKFFEVDREFIALAALYQLALTGTIDMAVVDQAQSAFAIDTEKPNPREQ